MATRWSGQGWIIDLHSYHAVVHSDFISGPFSFRQSSLSLSFLIIYSNLQQRSTLQSIMSSSSDSFVLSQPISNPYASLIARRRPAPAPVDVDFTVRLSIWERGSCQVDSHLANHIRFILQEIHGGGKSSNPWTVTALPRSNYPVGRWPQPIQVRD